MYWLSREVRFCIDPLLPRQAEGANAFAARPAGNGLCFFLALEVTLQGPLDKETGFVLNVRDIDRAVRARVVPVFIDRICNCFGRRRSVTFSVLRELLVLARRLLQDAFPLARLHALNLQITPYRRLTLSTEESAMAIFSEKFEFAAMHKLWNPHLSDTRNFELFDKCANPAGHGHNYQVEVSVRVPPEGDIDVVAFERTVTDRLISQLDHRSLNADVPYFKDVIPTIENIATFAWETLDGECGDLELDEVTIWESDRTRCSYRGSLR